MYTWTKDAFQSVIQYRVFVKVLSECRTWFLCMHQSNIYTLTDQLCYEFQERHFLTLNPSLIPKIIFNDFCPI